ncbi:PTS fructose transporter subunit IIB [Moritella viscosa]
MKIAIVTACPSGIASSLIAAGLLEKSVTELKWQANIECHSSVAPVTPLTDKQIVEADCIIVAASQNIDDARFIGKKVYRSEVDAVFIDAKAYLAQAVEKAVDGCRSVRTRRQTSRAYD